MIDILQEVTDWGKYPINNGIYHVNGAGQLVAYKPSRRKFVKLGQVEEQLADDVIIVQGSNGKTYTIQDGKCSCPGYTYRGNCKHVK